MILENIQRLRDEIESLERKIESYETMSEKVTTTLSHTKTFENGGINDRMSEITAKKMDAENTYIDLKIQLLDELFNLFWITEDKKFTDDERDIIRMRYIHQVKVKEIAKTIYVNIQTYYNYHDKAIQKLA